MPAPQTTPTENPLAFAMAPLAPFGAIAQAYTRAYTDLWASQYRFALAASRTATDAWMVAIRRQQDALMGAVEPTPAPQIEEDAKAVDAAAAAMHHASLDWMQAQVRALEMMRASA